MILVPQHSKICYQPPVVGEVIALLGYGLNNLETRTGAGIKREGFNYLRRLKMAFYFLKAAQATDNSGQNAASGSGDSGGPLFSVTKNCLIGVTSGIYQWV